MSVWKTNKVIKRSCGKKNTVVIMPVRQGCHSEEYHNRKLLRQGAWPFDSEVI